ncbi:ATP-binding cassette domain-containing protein [Candidatus Woesearchaeota archaeon]|nr:ATP-binding cassette domain-containing protein [Candidatus Woesearchaeota archaeon]
MGKNDLICLNGVRKNFGSKAVLEDISLEIKEGEVIGIVGKSGAGKTTLLKIIVEFLKKDGGDISFDREKINRSRHFSYFGFSTQEKSFYSRLTVKENLIYFASLHEMPKANLDNTIDNILQEVGLQDDKDTISSSLSQGMQKRLDIACSIVHDPDILVVDEPTADLDPGLRKKIWDLIRFLNKKKGKTIIISSHLPEELFAVCSRLFVLEDKKVKPVKKKKDMYLLYEDAQKQD